MAIATLLLYDQSPAIAQTSSYGELQSAYLYNFAKYIRWPAEQSQYVIGVYGESEITEDLRNLLKGKKIGGKEVVVRILTDDTALDEMHIVYLPADYSRKITFLKESTKGKSILLVTEEDLIKKGALISFTIEDDRLRFKLNKKAFANANLIASEGLLKLAILQ